MAFYLREHRNWSYFSFLSLHRDVIVTSSFLNGLNRNDDVWVWVKRFLREAKHLDPNNFTAIEKEVNQDRSCYYAKELQMFWEALSSVDAYGLRNYSCGTKIGHNTIAMIRNIILDALILTVISFGGIGNVIQCLYNDGLSNKNNISNYRFNLNERSQQLQQSQSQ
ncbi:hypothetical protein RhiirA4_478590 [Rhizophagus irregularis]|uniref:Uncharacterized protein n=1 Tax=Rhizophagus irregularis TaxID=588596 RepID=A0A2I1HF81_9GLOM|nr:hypothetical protein RhiirA4_478590 [Rhizophagus irregularis]